MYLYDVRRTKCEVIRRTSYMTNTQKGAEGISDETDKNYYVRESQKQIDRVPMAGPVRCDLLSALIRGPFVAVIRRAVGSIAAQRPRRALARPSMMSLSQMLRSLTGLHEVNVRRKEYNIQVCMSHLHAVRSRILWPAPSALFSFKEQQATYRVFHWSCSRAPRVTSPPHRTTPVFCMQNAPKHGTGLRRVTRVYDVSRMYVFVDYGVHFHGRCVSRFCLFTDISAQRGTQHPHDGNTSHMSKHFTPAKLLARQTMPCLEQNNPQNNTSYTSTVLHVVD